VNQEEQKVVLSLEEEQKVDCDHNLPFRRANNIRAIGSRKPPLQVIDEQEINKLGKLELNDLLSSSYSNNSQSNNSHGIIQRKADKNKQVE